jgi:hypothetical protein
VLLAAGLTLAELDRFARLMDDPWLAVRSWQLIYARGRNPG